MKNTLNFLALDFGASNGRAIIGCFDGQAIKLNEVHRFENRPVYMGKTLYWDFLRLFSELKNGISEACRNFKNIETIGVDTWGCDFGLLDYDKNLLSNPVHYRDKRTLGMSDKVKELVLNWDMYERTQAQIIEINTIYQLYYLKESKSPILENSKYLLLLGDLFNFFLTGELVCEFTNASLTQLLNQKEKKWEKHIINKLGLPEDIFIEITEPGRVIGCLNSEICNELGCKPLKVALPCYDTTSEITAIPVSRKEKSKNWAYLNCGTWAMVGLISDCPIVSREGFEMGFGNEGGFAGRYHYLKNLTGLWIIQQCRKKWIMDAKREISWKDIDASTSKAASKNIFIDVDDTVFEREIFDMPSCVLKYLKNTGQAIPDGIGEMSICAYESLALKYILNLKKLEKITGMKMELLHLVGGGSNNRLLCQWLSDASGLPLIAGPQETTSTGNLLAQMVASRAAANIDEAREIMINSLDLKYYLPDKNNFGLWQNKFADYIMILSLNI
jgi:rhamnulokinase